MNNYQNAVVGQLVELSWGLDGENAEWMYGVVEHIFDDRIHVTLENGSRYMHVTNVHENEGDILHNQKTKSHLSFLSKNGKPAMAKRRLFGGYIVRL